MKPIAGAVAAIALIALSWWLLDSAGPRADPMVDDDQPEATQRGTYDPVRAGEDTPDGYYQVLARDQIRPVYDPEFTDAAEAEWAGDVLVIGLERDGEAKAYPVSFLNYREMVNDWIGQTPILVTW